MAKKHLIKNLNITIQLGLTITPYIFIFFIFLIFLISYYVSRFFFKILKYMLFMEKCSNFLVTDLRNSSEYLFAFFLFLIAFFFFS